MLFDGKRMLLLLIVNPFCYSGNSEVKMYFTLLLRVCLHKKVRLQERLQIQFGYINQNPRRHVELVSYFETGELCNHKYNMKRKFLGSKSK